MKKLIQGVLVFCLLIVGSCAPHVKTNIVILQGSNYEMDCHLPAQWEDRLKEWNEWLLPPEDYRFVWVYCVTKSTTANPIELHREDFQLSYTITEPERYTTTLAARGNNDIYMRAPDRDTLNGGRFNYGGVTDAKGFGDRYVFAVPKNAQNLVLEITSMPTLTLSVR